MNINSHCFTLPSDSNFYLISSNSPLEQREAIPIELLKSYLQQMITPSYSFSPLTNRLTKLDCSAPIEALDSAIYQDRGDPYDSFSMLTAINELILKWTLKANQEGIILTEILAKISKLEEDMPDLRDCEDKEKVLGVGVILIHQNKMRRYYLIQLIHHYICESVLRVANEAEKKFANQPEKLALSRQSKKWLLNSIPDTTVNLLQLPITYTEELNKMMQIAHFVLTKLEEMKEKILNKKG